MNDAAAKMFHMFDVKPLSKDIWYWDNVVSYPNELVSFLNEVDLNKQSHSRIPEWTPWTASDNPDFVYGEQKIIYSGSKDISTGNEDLDRKTLYLINSFIMAAEMCFNDYTLRNGIDKSNLRLAIENTPIKRYFVGSSMGPHFDGQDGDEDLVYSLCTYLNDDYEGGELYFPNQDITIKPKAGSLVMFPSQMPYVHEVKPVTNGVRYMVAHSVYRKS